MSKQNWYMSSYLYFAVNVAPNTLHVIPVGDYAMLHGISYAKQTAMFLRFWSNKNISFQGTSHDPYMLRAPNASIGVNNCNKFLIEKQHNLLIGKSAFRYMFTGKPRFNNSGTLEF